MEGDDTGAGFRRVRERSPTRQGRERTQTESMKYYTGVPDAQQAQHIQKLTNSDWRAQKRNKGRAEKENKTRVGEMP